MLHIQTKQIKDNLVLQLKSDRENLMTMANFAAELYADGEDYGRMFDSFKPIGLFARIGILTPDNIFITKDGVFDLNGSLSFEEEALKEEHITGRTPSYSIPGEEVIRSAVPIKVNGKTMRDISNFVAHKLAPTDGVNGTETMFILKEYKTNGVDLDGIREDGERLLVTP